MNRSARAEYDLLDRILATKRREVGRLERRAGALRRLAESAPARPGLEAALRAGGAVGVIAEVKRRSPSAGEIRGAAPAAATAAVYAAAGAAAISVLTDGEYFGGSLEDLRSVVARVPVPVLRKDFTIDALQVYEARAAGASAVLLIVRVLEDGQLCDLLGLAEALSLDALVEVHDRAELERALATGARLIGVNNRDLSTFETRLAVTEELAPHVPADRLLVAESGIRTAADVERLAAAGAGAVLVGEALMRAPDAALAVRALAAVPRRS